MSVKKFEPGKQYQCTSSCDSGCVFSFEVLKRTAKTITMNYRGDKITRRVGLYEGMECVSPFGVYSMSPFLTAK